MSRTYIPWPAAPGNAATIVLFATHDRAAGGSGAIYRGKGGAPTATQADVIEIAWHRNNQASAANGVRVYALDDTGAWRETDLRDDADAPTIGAAAPQAVPLLAATQERRLTLVVSHLRGFAVEYTAGATGPTNWNGTITLRHGVLTVAR